MVGPPPLDGPVSEFIGIYGGQINARSDIAGIVWRHPPCNGGRLSIET
jgi:hypothetical protein